MSYQNENPHILEDRLEEAKKRLEEAKQSGMEIEDLYDLYCEVEELKDRVNFAWQDEQSK